jgi:hypothetical protein
MPGFKNCCLKRDLEAGVLVRKAWASANSVEEVGRENVECGGCRDRAKTQEESEDWEMLSVRSCNRAGKDGILDDGLKTETDGTSGTSVDLGIVKGLEGWEPTEEAIESSSRHT